MSREIKKIDGEFDPERCQAMTTKGQCPCKAVPGFSNCQSHGASNSSQNKRKVRMYRLSKFQARVHEFADSGKLKTLTEEIGIMRMMLEERLNQCTDEHDLLLNAGVISEMVARINGLVQSCHNLEEKTGALLNQTQLTAYIDQVLQIIDDTIEDKSVLAKIADKISAIEDPSD